MSTIRIGDIVPFGEYRWRVLSVQEDAALLLAEDIVTLRAYHDRPGDVTWAECELRQYLNGAFLDGFTPEERAAILPTPLDNPDNPWFGTPGGEPTVDHVFLPSIHEAVCL